MVSSSTSERAPSYSDEDLFSRRIVLVAFHCPLSLNQSCSSPTSAPGSSLNLEFLHESSNYRGCGSSEVGAVSTQDIDDMFRDLFGTDEPYFPLDNDLVRALADLEHEVPLASASHLPPPTALDDRAREHAEEFSRMAHPPLLTAAPCAEEDASTGRVPLTDQTNEEPLPAGQHSLDTPSDDEAGYSVEGLGSTIKVSNVVAANATADVELRLVPDDEKNNQLCNNHTSELSYEQFVQEVLLSSFMHHLEGCSEPFQSSRKWTHDSQEAEETETLLGNPPVCGRLIQNHPRGAGAESVATLQSDAEEVVTVAKNESTSTNSLLILPVAADRSKGKAKATAVESTCQAPTSTGHDDHEWAKTQSHNGIQDVGPAPARQARDEPFIGFAAADTSAVPAVVEPHPIADGTNTAQDPLTPSILGQYICRWDGCSELIIVPVDYEAQVVSDHMKNVHEVDVRSSGPPVSCLWPGCRQRTPYQAHSISRHVLSKRHGNIKYPCDQPGCTRKLGRKDLLARHKNKKHPGWDQVPASGVQNPAPLAAPVTTPSSSTPPPAPPPPPSAQPQPERPLKRRRCGK